MKVILRFSEIAKRLGGSSVRSVERKTDHDGPYYDPDFPIPVWFGENSKGIIEDEFDDYVRKLMARRDAELKGESVSETEVPTESPTPDPDQPPDAGPVEAA